MFKEEINTITVNDSKKKQENILMILADFDTEDYKNKIKEIVDSFGFEGSENELVFNEINRQIKSFYEYKSNEFCWPIQSYVDSWECEGSVLDKIKITMKMDLYSKEAPMPQIRILKKDEIETNTITVNEIQEDFIDRLGDDMNKAEDIEMKEIDAFIDAVAGKEDKPKIEIDPLIIAECEKQIYAIFKDNNLNANTASLVLMGCIGNVLNIISKANGTAPTHEFNKFWFVMIDSFNKTAERLDGIDKDKAIQEGA